MEIIKNHLHIACPLENLREGDLLRRIIMFRTCAYYKKFDLGVMPTVEKFSELCLLGL